MSSKNIVIGAGILAGLYIIYTIVKTKRVCDTITLLSGVTGTLYYVELTPIGTDNGNAVVRIKLPWESVSNIVILSLNVPVEYVNPYEPLEYNPSIRTVEFTDRTSTMFTFRVCK